MELDHTHPKGICTPCKKKKKKKAESMWPLHQLVLPWLHQVTENSTLRDLKGGRCCLGSLRRPGRQAWLDPGVKQLSPGHGFFFSLDSALLHLLVF